MLLIALLPSELRTIFGFCTLTHPLVQYCLPGEVVRVVQLLRLCIRGGLLISFISVTEFGKRKDPCECVWPTLNVLLLRRFHVTSYNKGSERVLPVARSFDELL